jgi:diaminohydroxyphosphoribosylaminopyrimidine deaminase/5-amino-6-(5-phosphoribosylamino)uracil reductase
MAPALTRGPRGADRRHLAEAVALAERGRFAVEPNPPVGCVVVARDGEIVGRGWHRAYGGPHAEVEALREAGRRARGATAYVSLEPCSTTTAGGGAGGTAKKTGPCTEALARAGIRRVVYAALDPDPRHRGRAAAALREAGIETRGNAAPALARAGLGAFRRSLALPRPWVVAKWAMSLDGRIAASRGVGTRLSGKEAERFVHDLRGRVEAVAVGVGTVFTDDPRLTCRLPGGPPHGRPQPLRVVFDTTVRTPPEAALIESASEKSPVLLVCARAPADAARRLRGIRGVELAEVPDRDGGVDLPRALHVLKARGVRRVLVEGGSRLLGAFFREGLVDQVAVIAAPLFLGADGAPTALSGTGFTDRREAPRLAPMRASTLGEDVLVEGYVRDGSRPTAGGRS